MFLFSFCTRPQARRRQSQAYRFRPSLEVLEGRALPSILLVTNTNDTGVSGDGSLRGEIAAAASGDTIEFAGPVHGKTITLTKGELALTKSLDIEGSAANPVVICGNNASRVFDITSSSATVLLSGLTITQGNAASGGGISNSGTLTLDRSTLSGNTASAFANEFPYGNVILTVEGGGIFNSGTLTLNHSIVSGNTASATALGYDATPTVEGGGIFNSGTLTLNYSTLAGNAAYANASAYGNPIATAEGGGIFNSGTLTLNQSTLSDNTAHVLSGGLYVGIAIAEGGGIYNDTGAMLTVSQCTLSGNTASATALGLNPSATAEGGGIFNHSGATLNVLHSSITGNTQDDVDNDGTLNRDNGSTIGVLD